MGRAEIEQYLADILPWEDPELIRKGIRPDRRPWYAQGDVKRGLPAYEALYHHVDEIRAERFYELDLSGYGDENNRDPGWPDHELRAFDSKHRDWRLLMDSLEEDLLNRLLAGDLQARGFNSAAPLDSERQLIAAERWRDLTLNVKESTAVGPGLAVTQILIAEQASSSPNKRTNLRATTNELRKWYIAWIAQNEAEGLIPTRNEDFSAVKAKFGDKITSIKTRALRRELAPAKWTRKGRRTGIKNQKGRDATDADDT